MPKKEYLEEGKEFFKSFLETTFFKSYKENTRSKDVASSTEGKDLSFLSNYKSLELDFSYKCDLNCSYCYYAQHGKDLFRGKSPDKDTILANLEKIMKMLKKNNFTPEIEIFTGDFLNLPYWREALDILYSGLGAIEEDNRPNIILIPLNYTILIGNNLEKEVHQYIDKFRKIRVAIGFSASFDGPFMDFINRPSKIKDTIYTSDFYKRVLKFNQETKTGSHPMIFSKNSEYILDNLMWFSEVENNLSTYLLEIRNPEWKIEELRNLYYSTRAYVLFQSKKYNFNHKILEETRNDNITTSIFGSIGRGMGCSIQSSIQLQLHDLSITPCHRLSYEGQIPGKFIIDDDGNFDLEVYNPELYIAIQATQASNLPLCNNCPINKLCSGPCLGSNFESTGEIFAPHPNVCLLEYVKTAGLIHGLDEIGYIDYHIKNQKNRFNLQKISQINYIRDLDINKILGDK